MKPARLAILILTVMMCATAFAQKEEVSVDYSYFAFYPAKSLAKVANLYGGGGAFVYNFSRHLGIKSEFEGYLSKTAQFTLPANPPIVPAAGTFKSQMNMFTFLFGPQFSFPVPSSKVRIFTEALFGGAYTNAWSNLFNTAGINGLAASKTGLAMSLGGGVDLGINDRVAFRIAEVDYVGTRYSWPTIGIQNQNSVRYQGGFVFVFGSQ